MPIIQVENLIKRYDDAERNAVDGISFTVEPGEFFTLLGPNGAGKTTTISILTTTLVPTDGTAQIAGYDVETQASEVRRNVGIIFQKPSLDMNLTGEENVRFHAIMYGLYSFRPSFGLMPASYKARINELAEVLGIDKDVFNPVKTYSGGMKRKLEIIRSLMHKPRVLFLDEPTVGLDPASRRNLWQYINHVQATSDTTVFLTTHYLDEAEQADTICIINQGQIVSYGSPDAVKADLVEAYLLVDTDDPDRLRAELTELGLTFDDDHPFKIYLNRRTIHQILKTIDTPLTMVKTHTPSLEDAYLAIVEQL